MKKEKLMKIQERLVFLLIFLFLLPIGVIAQQKMITGQVVDEQGEAVIGASVMVKGAKTGTITDLDGNFSVQGKAGQTLSISYVGYTPLDVKITKLQNNRFVLKENTEVLDEVVVVGMDTQKRNTITAAVSVVKGDDIVNRPITDLTSALQGNVAGLNFASDAMGGAKGGELGTDIKFNIRGVGSINGGEPYVLVDGIEQSMQNVNPADVASISVLKDASAAAIYGARAAYGVVLVTTKSGNSEKAKVSYSGTVGFSSPIRTPQMMNSLEFAYYNNALYDAGASASGINRISDSVIEKIKGFMQNPYSEEFPGIDVSSNGEDWASAYYVQYGNTDWFKYYYKDKSIRHSHNLSVQGGSQKINYYIGMGYVYQEGFLDHVKDDLSKYNLNTKLQAKPTDWLRFNLNNNITLQMIKRPMPNQSIIYNKIGSHRPSQVTHLPIDSKYNIPSWNETLFMQNSNYENNRLSDALSVSATATLMKGWDVTAEMKIRFDVENNNMILYENPQYETPLGTLKPGDATGRRQGFSYPNIDWKLMKFGSYARGSLFNYYLSPNVSSMYIQQWGKHSFKAMAGFQMEMKEDSNEYMYKDGMMSNDIFSFANASGNVIAGEDRTHWATMGAYLKLNWNYDNIYFFEFSGRYDGSSRFAKGNRWGFFPSFSAGYDIARTDYFQRLKLPVSQLKVRVSYGRLGNQNGAGLYDYLATMSLDALGSNGWLLPTASSASAIKGTIAKTPKMVSPFITWEKVDNANLGLDLMLFDNRLSLEANIYQRMTRDMIGPAEAIPDISGIASENRSKINNATLRNRGWELSVNWHDQLKCGFSYGVGFNVFSYKAVVTKYNNPDGTIYNNHTGYGPNKGYYEGMDLGEIWGYQADDLFMTNREIDDYLRKVDMSALKPDDMWRRGDLKYIDSNNDGKIDGGDGTIYNHGDLKIIGNTTPKYSFGINLNVGYKGFEVSTLLQGVAKRDFPISGSSYMFSAGSYNFKEHLDYFSPETPNGFLPRLTSWKNNQDFYVNTGYNSTRYLLNAAYMRMKNLTVSYNFDKKLLKHIGISRLKLYVACDNLFTVTKLPKQFDPETLNQVNGMAGGTTTEAPGLTSPVVSNGNGMVYPLNRNFVFGLDFTF